MSRRCNAGRGAGPGRSVWAQGPAGLREMCPGACVLGGVTLQLARHACHRVAGRLSGQEMRAVPGTHGKCSLFCLHFLHFSLRPGVIGFFHPPRPRQLDEGRDTGIQDYTSFLPAPCLSHLVCLPALQASTSGLRTTGSEPRIWRGPDPDPSPGLAQPGLPEGT